MMPAMTPAPPTTARTSEMILTGPDGTMADSPAAPMSTRPAPAQAAARSISGRRISPRTVCVSRNATRFLPVYTRAPWNNRTAPTIMHITIPPAVSWAKLCVILPVLLATAPRSGRA